MHNFSTFSVTLFVAAIVVAGCNQPQAPNAKDTTKTGQPEAKSSGDHHHGSGPHGGTVADWGGGKYHVEFTVDHDKKEATVYILGDDAASPAPVKADSLLLSISDPQFQVDLMATPLDGETAGFSSRFAGTNERLGKVQEFSGTISGEVDGKPYAGDFQEEPEGHSHE